MNKIEVDTLGAVLKKGGMEAIEFIADKQRKCVTARRSVFEKNRKGPTCMADVFIGLQMFDLIKAVESPWTSCEGQVDGRFGYVLTKAGWALVGGKPIWIDA